MYRQSWLRTEIERWMLRTAVGIFTAVAEFVLMAIVAIAAGLWSFVRTVLWPLAQDVTTRIMTSIESAYISHQGWPSLGLFPMKASWQRMIVGAVLWLATTASMLAILWFHTLVRTRAWPHLPGGSGLLLVITGAGLLGALAGMGGSNRNNAEGISLQ